MPYAGFRPLGNDAVMQDTSLWGELNVHDPAIIKDGQWYYVFSTDASLGNLHPLGIQIRRSKDLVTWEYRGAAFKDFEKDCAEPIAWSGLDPKKKEGLWAPDIIKEGNRYRLYFSASSFGSVDSCIGLAEAKNIEGPYTYKGMVVKSRSGDGGPNTIDPALTSGADGKLYMAYGSFFGGIYIAELDRKTGFIKNNSEKPVKIAGGSHSAVEGAAIIYVKETDYYYLFVSYGSLSSNYNVRVARSKNITGPYLDARGHDMNELPKRGDEETGVKLLGGWDFSISASAGGYKAPGHNSVFQEDGEYFMVHHVRSYRLPDYWFYMNVRSFFINSFGWPVVMPHRYYGKKAGAAGSVSSVSIEGEYAFIEHGSDSNRYAHQSRIIKLQGGSISGFEVPGTYHIYDKRRVKFDIEGKIYDGLWLEQYDWEHDAWVTAFSAASEDGFCVWGTLLADSVSNNSDI
ncbi:beta-xylosidase [Spirochaetia bacterium]|nr:beta-xylosidase [Spirochaetia bacterium]